MSRSDAAAWSLRACEMVGAYRSGALDPVEVLDACLDRLDMVNPRLNAVVTVDREGARRAAEASSARWAAAMPASALDGVPVTVKDNLHVAGMRTTWGSLLFRDFVPDRDDIAIGRLRAAGAVILGKTNTPELALAGYTANRLFGSTGNPWAPELSPGGSSGGAVAAVMSGIAPIAIATDAGGSTRRPASHAGCLGLKTSLGLVPRRYGFPPLAADFQTVGTIARSVADIRLALDIMAGSFSPAAARPYRIGCFADIGGAPVDPEILARFEETKLILRELGHQVTEIPAPYRLQEIDPLFRGLASAGVARAVTSLPDWEEHAGEAIVGLAKAGRELTAMDYIRLLDQVAAFRARIIDTFDTADLLLTPSAAALPWPRDEAFPAFIAGQRADARGSAIYTTFANVGGLPGISVPARPSGSGLPIGIQLVGPQASESALLALAAQLEHHAPWPSLAPLHENS